MGDAVSKKTALKLLGYVRETVIYSLIGILPVLALAAAVIASGRWQGFYLMFVLVFLIGYATIRYGGFLGLTPRQWWLAAPLFLAGYVPSFVYMLYRSREYYRDPPPPPRRRVEDDPDYHPRGDSVVLDWSEPHGSGGGS
jgi:hypothetical protein